MTILSVDQALVRLSPMNDKLPNEMDESLREAHLRLFAHV